MSQSHRIKGGTTDEARCTRNIEGKQENKKNIITIEFLLSFQVFPKKLPTFPWTLKTGCPAWQTATSPSFQIATKSALGSATSLTRGNPRPAQTLSPRKTPLPWTSQSTPSLSRLLSCWCRCTQTGTVPWQLGAWPGRRMFTGLVAPLRCLR